MSEYTFKNIVIDPTSEKAKNCIGKMVYFADNPTDCLTYANSGYDDMAMILESIQLDSNFPFRFGAHEEYYFSCIIPKKEEPKSEYVPFKNVSEFIGAYKRVEACKLKDENLSYLSIRGIWLKYKATDTRLVVTEIWDNGLTIGSDTAVTRWNEFLKYYEFLDGTPCGKLKENE